MNEWRKVKLGEIINILNGYSFKKEDFSEYGIPVIKIKNIKSLIVDTEDVQFVNENFYEAKKKYRVNYKDILLSMTGSHISQINSVVGRVARMKKIGKYLLNQRVAKLVSKDKKILNEDFLYYFLSQEETTYQLALSAGGSANQANIGNNNIYELIINLPSIFLQEKIAKILSDIDEKIELNNKINNNLEEQAQLIFKSWFIDNPQKYSWKQGTFSDIIKNTLGGDWGKEQPNGNYIKKVFCIRGADIPSLKKGDKKNLPIRYILEKNYDTKKLLTNDLVIEISGGSPIQSTGRIAHISKYSLECCSKNLICTNFCRAMRPKNNFSMFIFYYWQYLYDKGIFFSYENGTTGIKNLDLSGFITSEPIYIPTEDLLFKFDDFCQKISNIIFSNGKQNEKLINLKNYLLPKLMNGEIDVENIEL